MPQCWSQDHSVRPSARRIADWLKELLNQTATAQNVARGLLATVARLVSASNSAYMFEREDALKKLRDMLDPGQVQQFCVCMCAACASWCTC